MKLSDRTGNRDNNFNLVRIVAALAVLADHSFVLATGTVNARPFLLTSSLNISFIAVDVFFITSGFLVTASLLARENIMDFVLSRALRIYPALIVMQLFIVFGLGLLFTSITWQSYLTSHDTAVYWVKGSTLVTGLVTTLPGVFENNPFKNTVNGSLWTMPYEIGMYAILAAIWAGLHVVPGTRSKAFKAIIVGLAIAAVVLFLLSHRYMIPEGKFLRLFVMFFLGAAAFSVKEGIVLSRSVCVSLMILLPLIYLFAEEVLFYAYVVALPYILLYLAYIPAGIVRKYNQVGDYSYGVYIYAWPVQQSIASLLPGVSSRDMLLISASITIVLAVLSWRLIEEPALRVKRWCVGYTKALCPVGS